ncbi:GyrI-like domain-containing protein [Evansella halocellulosilytica]|uniref:GyrI-like domain-containing protein n=1 Tax=Evansella halocellulosilytica TaxID=2011013 RepID=UPI000BB8ACA3|nr:GyrI-like domain-containing protein [Evansella halocellulosilytica]
MRIIDTRIENKDSFQVVGLEIDWTPNDANPAENEIAHLWREFNERKSEIPNAMPNRTYGLERFQPNAGPAAPLKYLASIEVSNIESEPPKGMIAADVPASTYAVVTYQGIIDGIGKAYDHYYRQWEPAMREYRAAHTFCFEYYDERYKDNDNDESIIEVWFALTKTS